jgi:hypothetical protein
MHVNYVGIYINMMQLKVDMAALIQQSSSKSSSHIRRTSSSTQL